MTQPLTSTRTQKREAERGTAGQNEAGASRQPAQPDIRQIRRTAPGGPEAVDVAWLTPGQTSGGDSQLDLGLNAIHEKVSRLVPCDRMSVARLDRVSGMLRCSWVKCAYQPVVLETGYCAPLTESNLLQVAHRLQPRVIGDMETCLRNGQPSDSTRRLLAEGLRSSLTFALKIQGQLLGFAFVCSRQPEAYGRTNPEILEPAIGELATLLHQNELGETLAEQNQRMRYVAHSLKGSLGVMQGYLDLMLNNKQGPLTGIQRNTLERMILRNHAMIEEVNNLIDLSAFTDNMATLRRQAISPASLLDELCQAHGVVAGAKSIRILRRLEPGLPKIRLDAGQMLKALGNLLENAIKFSHPNTTIRIGMRRAEGMIEIYVADEGQGIPAGEFHLLFRDFGRTSVRATAGEPSTGLGLAIAKRIVEGHGGRILVQSREGLGSIFSVLIPIGAPSHAAHTVRDVCAAAKAGPNRVHAYPH
jgi:signal transduction histidine kinase